MINTLTEYIAKQTMELKDTNLCMCLISMIWRERPALVAFDNLNKNIIDFYFDIELQDGDRPLIEKMIIDFLA